MWFGLFLFHGITVAFLLGIRQIDVVGLIKPALDFLPEALLFWVSFHMCYFW